MRCLVEIVGCSRMALSDELVRPTAWMMQCWRECRRERAEERRARSEELSQRGSPSAPSGCSWTSPCATGWSSSQPTTAPCRCGQHSSQTHRSRSTVHHEANHSNINARHLTCGGSTALWHHRPGARSRSASSASRRCTYSIPLIPTTRRVTPTTTSPDPGGAACDVVLRGAGRRGGPGDRIERSVAP